MASMSDAPEVKQEFQPVLCDMCLDKQTPALKTCLKCEISMCAQHLQAHLTTPVLLQTHPLTKPTAPGGLNSGAVRCPEHGKLLEYYCLDDRTCVCVSCSIEDQHRLHNMKTLPSAHKVLVEKLREELKDLAEREKRGKALKSWETGQTKALETSGKDLVKGVLALRDTGLTKVLSSVTARLGDIQTARQNIEAALSEEDAHLFLQRYAEVHEAVEKARAVDFIHGLEEKAEPGEVVFNLLKIGHEVIEKVRKLQRDLLVFVDPDEQYWGRNETADVTFDPKTTGEYFCLSSDLKVLSCRSPGDVSQRVYLQNSTKDDLYWRIQFSEKYDWSVGIGVKSSDALRYGLQWKNKQFSEFYTETSTEQSDQYGCYGGQFNLTSKVLTDIPKFSPLSQCMGFLNELEVQWESSTRSLSFFTRGDYDEIVCLHSVDIDSGLSQELFPFIIVEKRENDPPTTSGSVSYSGCSRCSRFSNSPYVNFVCALDDRNKSDPPTKKRKRI